jgi:hypothetical protein
LNPPTTIIVSPSVSTPRPRSEILSPHPSGEIEESQRVIAFSGQTAGVGLRLDDPEQHPHLAIGARIDTARLVGLRGPRVGERDRVEFELFVTTKEVEGEEAGRFRELPASSTGLRGLAATIVIAISR